MTEAAEQTQRSFEAGKSSHKHCTKTRDLPDVKPCSSRNLIDETILSTKANQVSGSNHGTSNDSIKETEVEARPKSADVGLIPIKDTGNEFEMTMNSEHFLVANLDDDQAGFQTDI